MRLATALPLPLLTALAIGAGGGWAFSAMGIPLPWILGAMTATIPAAILGVPMQVSHRFRLVFVAVLGLVLGGAFTPEVLDRAPSWAGSLVGLAGFLAAAGTLAFMVLRRTGRFDTVTAFFASAPGGLGEMVLFAHAYGGDERAVSLIHSMRIVVSVAVIPIGYRLFAGYVPQPGPGAVAGWAISFADVAALLAIAVAGYLLGKVLRLPAAALVGPMVLCAAAHLAGWTAAKPPANLVAFAQVVLGASIGARFAGVSVGRVADVLVAGSGLTVAMLLLAAGFAFGVSETTGLPFSAVLLGFAPGGLVEMCLVSIGLGIDTAFVSTHHLLRIAIIVMAAPLVFRYLNR